MADYLPPVVIDILGRDRDLVDTIADAKAALGSLPGDKKVLLGADGRPLQSAVDDAKAALDSLPDEKTVTIRAEMDSSGIGAGGGDGGGDGGGGGGRGLFGSLGAFFGSALLSRVLVGKGGGGRFGYGIANASLLGMGGLGPIHAIMTALGLATSAGGAMAGGGLLGLGSLGVGAVGMGTDMAGTGQALNDLKQYSQAYDNLQKAVAVYGANSAQAQHAQAALNYTLAGFPAAAQPAIVALHQTTSQFHDMFNQATQNAEKFGAEIVKQAVTVGEKFLPVIGEFATENTQLIQVGLQPLFDWMGSGTGGLGIFYDLEQEFQQQLPTAIHAFSQAFELLMKTVDTASHFTGGFIHTLDDFFTRWNGADWGRWQEEIGNLVALFREWEQFAKIVAQDLYQVFHADAGTGKAIIESLTGMLDKLHAYLASTQGQNAIHNVFETHKQEILTLLQLLPPLLQTFGKIELATTPALTQAFTQALQAIMPVVRVLTSFQPTAFLLGVGMILFHFHKLGAALKLVQSGFEMLRTALFGAAAGEEAFAASSVAAEAGAAGMAAAVAGLAGTLLGLASAGAAAYMATTWLLDHTPIGGAVKSGANAVANWLGVGPQQAYQDNLGKGLNSSNQTEIDLLVARATGAFGGGTLPKDISPSDAKGMLHNLKVPGYAAGTSYSLGGLSLVGENGPELVKLPTGSQVVPTPQTKQMLNAGQSITVHVHGDVKDPHKMATDLAWEIRTITPS